MIENLKIINRPNGDYTLILGDEIYALNKSKYHNSSHSSHYLKKLKPNEEYISGMFEKKKQNKHYFQGNYKGKAIIIDLINQTMTTREIKYKQTYV